MNGCLSDGNCSSNQTCEDVDSGTHVGTCKNKPVTAAPTTKDCKTFCDKALACQDPNASQCNQECTGLIAKRVACVNDSNCGAGCDAVCAI